MRRWLVVGLLSLGLVGFRGGWYRSGSEDARMVPPADTARGEFSVFWSEKISGLVGLVVVNKSPDSVATGFGLSQSGDIWVRSESREGAFGYTLDSVGCVSFPCTLYVNAYDDTLFVENVKVYWRWADTVTSTNDTAHNTVDYRLKATW